jgi:hypothetical protein
LTTGEYVVSYHFELLEHPPVYKTIPIGNRFGRFFRRLVHARTERTVKTCYSVYDRVADPPPPPHYTIARDGQIRIDVYVGDFPQDCINTESSQIASNSHF